MCGKMIGKIMYLRLSRYGMACIQGRIKTDRKQKCPSNAKIFRTSKLALYIFFVMEVHIMERIKPPYCGEIILSAGLYKF